MKNSIKTLIAAAFTTVLFSAASFTAKAENKQITTTLADVRNINKISVSGNVELILVQSAVESVKVYDQYYSKNAVVQKDGSLLRISSFENKKLVVVVYISNLSSLELQNTSTVATYGKFNLLSLDVVLRDSATANISGSVLSLSTFVHDNANLKLTGTAEDYNSVMSATSSVHMENFTAISSATRSMAPVFNTKIALSKESLENIEDTI